VRVVCGGCCLLGCKCLRLDHVPLICTPLSPIVFALAMYIALLCAPLYAVDVRERESVCVFVCECGCVRVALDVINHSVARGKVGEWGALWCLSVFVEAALRYTPTTWIEGP
jgi:uncharacterized membrane protein